MDKYELICQYCGHRWNINYVQDYIKCDKCKDSNIRVRDNSKKANYYVDCPEFIDDDEWSVT